MSRLDLSVDNAAIQAINGIDDDLTTLRSRQSIARALVTRAYVIQTANSIDIGPVSVAANSGRPFTITFTGDGTQQYPYGTQYSQVFNNGTSSGNRMSDYQLLDSTGSSYNWALQAGATLPYAVNWFIFVQAGSSGANVYMKIRVLASCKGSLSVTY